MFTSIKAVISVFVITIAFIWISNNWTVLHVNGNYVSGVLTEKFQSNGIVYMYIQNPVFEKISDDGWQFCQFRQNEYLKGLHLKGKNQIITDFAYILQRGKNSYRMLIKADTGFVYLHEYPDFGGGEVRDVSEILCETSPKNNRGFE